MRSKKSSSSHADFAPLAASPAAAARIAGVGRTSIYHAMGLGELKSSKVGTRRLILIEELRRWLRSHEVAL
jgi:hypothetical protein